MTDLPHGERRGWVHSTWPIGPEEASNRHNERVEGAGGEAEPRDVRSQAGAWERGCGCGEGLLFHQRRVARSEHGCEGRGKSAHAFHARRIVLRACHPPHSGFARQVVFAAAPAS